MNSNIIRYFFKLFLYPSYFFLIKVLRRHGLLSTPSIKICITTTKGYAETTVPLVLQSLLDCGFQKKDIFIFEGGYEFCKADALRENYFLVDHNSFDFTALIEVSTSTIDTDYWFLLHDTCMVSLSFARLIKNIPHFWPDVMPIKNYPSMNIGAYKKDFLTANKNSLLLFKNKIYDSNVLQHVKKQAIENEDFLFKKSIKSFVYNSWMMRRDEFYETSNKTVDAYDKRICEFYPQIGIFKFKANNKIQFIYKLTI